MSVLDQLPEGEPLRLLREQQQSMRELKAPQTFGSSSVVTSRVFSNDAYDILTPSTGTPIVEVEFIPDDLTFGGAFCYTFYAVDVTSPGFELVLMSEVIRLRVTDDRQRWLVEAGTSVKLKFYFFTAGTGSFTTNIV